MPSLLSAPPQSTVLLLIPPPASSQLPFLQLAFSVAIILFLLLEVVRLAHVAPLSAHLTSLLLRFVDDRDVGTLILTHLYLLVGCGGPILLGLVYTSRDCLAHRLAPFAGLSVLGIGDAVASIVGSNFGVCKWPRSSKTVEGTTAAFVSTFLLLRLIDGILGHSGSAWEWVEVGMCVLLTCLLEASTSQIDNLFLPIFFMASLLIVSLPH
ncbi:MAG: hypothetical protein SGPRY_009466 [Prymnesium sp.]